MVVARLGFPTSLQVLWISSIYLKIYTFIFMSQLLHEHHMWSYDLCVPCAFARICLSCHMEIYPHLIHLVKIKMQASRGES